ncbi:sensor histidine kinase [Niabella yanshanensis]|nr:histidine kinase [Niabella yanshanensis]
MKELTLSKMLTFLFTLGALNLSYGQNIQDYQGGITGGTISFSSKTNTRQYAFGLSVHPVPYSGLKGKFYINYPKNENRKQTNLHYFPGVEKIRISLHIDTAVYNIDDMRYFIMDGDSTIRVDWSKPPRKGRWQAQENGESTTTVFLDNIECNNKVLTIKLYSIKNPESILTTIVSTKILENPLLYSVTALSNLDGFSKREKRGKPSLSRRTPLNLKNASINNDINISGVTLVLRPNNSIYFFRSYLIREEKGNADTINLHLNWSLKEYKSFEGYPPGVYSASLTGFTTKPGKYKILITTADYGIESAQYGIREEGSPANTFPPAYTEMEFEVLQPYTFSLVSVFLIIGALMVCVCLWVLYSKKRQQKKILKEQLANKEVQLNLQSIRSQLNPHFIFNALSGIQTLMNKNETDTANEYLAKFARLTRRVLDDAGKEQVSLADEAALLDDYLKMEQLRFGFQYNITIDDKLSEDIQIPVMLLQPLVENAVKHGMVEKKKNGVIEVGFSKNGDNLVLKVTDNGEGFDKESLVSGKGLELTKNRVSLSNTIYKNTPLSFDIEPTTAGTAATIILKNWLS